MNLSKRICAICMLILYVKKINFLFSFLFRNYVSVFGYKINVNDYVTILHLFDIQRHAKIFVKSKNGLKIPFDHENYFYISSNFDNYDQALIKLLSNGLKAGVRFLDEEYKNSSLIEYNKTIKIIQSTNIIYCRAKVLEIKYVGRQHILITSRYA